MQEMAQSYIDKKYTDANEILDAIEGQARSIRAPDGLDTYARWFDIMQKLLDRVKRTDLMYSMQELQQVIIDACDDKLTQMQRQEDEINQKFEAEIQQLSEELEKKAKEANQEARARLAEANSIYLGLEEKRKKLEAYADAIIDRCSVYGVTSPDIAVTNQSFTTQELDSLYDQYIAFMEKPKNRKNVIRQFREKVPDARIRGAALLAVILLLFTPALDVAVIAGIIAVVVAQTRVKDTMRIYSLLLGLIFNVQPLSLGFKEEVDESELVPETVDEDGDERFEEIAAQWEAELESVDIEAVREEQSLKMQEFVNSAAEIKSSMEEKQKAFKQRKSELWQSFKDSYDTKSAEFADKKAKIKLLGTEVQASSVFNTRFRLGLKEDVMEESIDIGLSNILIRPCSDNERQVTFLQVLLANAICNVRGGNLIVHIYDPNRSGQDLATFYDKALEDIFTITTDNLDGLIGSLRAVAMENMKDLQGKSINDFNAEAETVGKVTKDYHLLMVLSQPKRIEEDEALSKFMEYSAGFGVLVWLVSNKTLPNTYVFEEPFGKVKNPYPVDLHAFGQKVAQSLITARKNNRVKPILWQDFIKLTVPEERMWSYSGNAYLDIDPGLINGDPSKFAGYTVGNKGDVHALAAGATGSGKSVFLNAVIATLCQKYSPRDLELWLIDYKALEFGFFLPTPERDFTFPQIKACLCTTDGDYAESVYAALDKKCTDRFKYFQGFGVKNLKEFNELMENNGTPEKRLPRVLFINDEFQVIFEKAQGKVIESIVKSLTDIAKLGRAAGVHLFFTSQSMNKTVSKDVLDQFSLRFALRCTEDLSVSLLGTKKAAQIKEPQGFLVASSVSDTSRDAQKKYKIPLAEPDILLAHMKKLWNAAIEQGMPKHDLISYEEKTTHSIAELDEFYDSLNAGGSKIPETGLIFLGNRMTYSVTNRAPENVILLPEANSHIMAIFSDNIDFVNFYKQVLCNIRHFRKAPMVFVNSQVDDLHYLCSVEDMMEGEMARFGTRNASIFELYALFDSIYQRRVETGTKDDPAYFILLGWDKAIGFGIDKDTILASNFANLLKQCGEYNMHFIMLCNGVESISANVTGAFKFRICGKCDEKSSYAMIDTKQGSQPSDLENGYLYLKSGNKLPSRAKLYLSPQDREIKDSTFVM